MNQVIELTGDTAIIQTPQPRQPGTDVDVKIRMPEGVLATHLIITGTVIRCECITSNADRHYLLEMKIGRMPSVDHKILTAYREFLERQKTLASVRIDLEEIQEAFDTFGRNLRQLRKTAEELRNNLRGTLELMKIKAEGKTTIH